PQKFGLRNPIQTEAVSRRNRGASRTGMSSGGTPRARSLTIRSSSVAGMVFLRLTEYLEYVDGLRRVAVGERPEGPDGDQPGDPPLFHRRVGGGGGGAGRRGGVEEVAFEVEQELLGEGRLGGRVLGGVGQHPPADVRRRVEEAGEQRLFPGREIHV